MVEFLNNRFNLAGKVLDVWHGTIVLIFSVFSRLELLLNFAFDLALEFGFEVWHCTLVAFHLCLVVLFLDIVLADGGLDLGTDGIVLLHLLSTLVFLCIEFFLYDSHFLLELGAQVLPQLAFLIKHHLVLQVEIWVFLQKRLTHHLQGLAHAHVLWELALDFVDLAQDVLGGLRVLSAFLSCFSAQVSQGLHASLLKQLQVLFTRATLFK